MSETQVREYKSLKKIRGGSADFKELAKTCVCLANSQGGEIFIGYEDKQQSPPASQKITDEDINETLRKLRGLAFSVALSSTSVIVHPNGGEYFILTVHPSLKSTATTSDGKIYLRIGEECVPARGEDIHRIASEKEAFQWELQIKNIGLEEVNPREIENFVNDIRNSDKVKHFVKDKSDIEILEHYNLLTNNKLTNLGVLWLGNPQQRARISYPITVQYLVYDNLDKKVRKESWTDNTLNPKNLLLNIEAQATELKYFHEFPEGLFRKRVRHYSDRVVRELFVNSFAHKSFTISADISIEVYPDRMEISNPGGLPLGITKNNILHQKHRRNPHFINIFHDLGLMEAEGSGYDLIYEELSRDSKPYPEIIADYNSVKIIQQSKIINEEDLVLMDYITQHFQLSQKEFIALGQIIRHKKVNSPQLVKLLQLSEEERLRSWVGKLLEKDIIISRGQKKGTDYLINPKLIASSKLNVRPTLKTIEPHTLKALIIEDLKINPNSTISQIFEHLSKQVLENDIRKVMYSLVKEDVVGHSIPTKGRTYFLK